MERRWLFADQLGPHFLDARNQPVLIVESRAALRRRPVHRRRAHLVLSALRHRAAELGDQAVLIQAATYREAIGRAGEDLSVCSPTSRAARGLVTSLPGVRVLPACGFGTSAEEFGAWAERRDGAACCSRTSTGTRGAGWTPDGRGRAGRRPVELRRAGPGTATRGGLDVRGPARFTEDEIDEQVRRDLDRRRKPARCG